jgi:mersacidin/lichenicidin family type 2 lantibiotic
MSHVDIIRALKESEYRRSLNKVNEQEKPPVHSARFIELKDIELEAVSGGRAIGPEWIPK